MTAYQGTRPDAVPALLPRRRLVVPSRAGRRQHPVGLLLAAVLLCFLLGLMYVGQAITLGATNYEHQRLVGYGQDLARQIQTVEADISRYGSEQYVLDRAQRAGLVSLGARQRIAAR